MHKITALITTSSRCIAKGSRVMDIKWHLFTVARCFGGREVVIRGQKKVTIRRGVRSSAWEVIILNDRGGPLHGIGIRAYESVSPNFLQELDEALVARKMAPTTVVLDGTIVETVLQVMR